MFTLFSTPLFTPLVPEFSCCYRPSARSNTPHFPLILTAALKWIAMACPPDLWRACPPRRVERSRPPGPLWNSDMYALQHDTETAAAVPFPFVSGPLRDLCGHVSIRLPLGSALSTLNCELSTCSVTPLECALAGGYDGISSEMNTYEKCRGGPPIEIRYV